MSKFIDFPFFVKEELYEIYEESVQERIEELLKDEGWNDWDMEGYESDKERDDFIYVVAERQACKELEYEIEDVSKYAF